MSFPIKNCPIPVVDLLKIYESHMKKYKKCPECCGLNKKEREEIMPFFTKIYETKLSYVKIVLAVDVYKVLDWMSGDIEKLDFKTRIDGFEKRLQKEFSAQELIRYNGLITHIFEDKIPKELAQSRIQIGEDRCVIYDNSFKKE